MGSEPAFARPSDGAKYDLLRSLSNGQLGQLALGRASGQSDAGRFVTLRLLPSTDFARLEAAVRRAASIAHPRLVKVLGLAWVKEVPYLASEYVEGLSVGDLSRALTTTETSAIQGVALRIALDTLQAVSDARGELRQRGVSEPSRCLYPDTAWVATFGETLLSDVGVTGELVGHAKESEHDRAWSPPDGSGGSSAQSDVFACGALLFELLSGRDLATVRRDSAAAIPALDELPRRGKPIAKPLVELVSRALALDPSQRFQTPEDMARAIRELPQHWLGSEDQVRAMIEPLAHGAANLKASEPSLDLSSGEHMVDLWEIPTRSLRLRLPSPEDDRQTLRPEYIEPSSESQAPSRERSADSNAPSIEVSIATVAPSTPRSEQSAEGSVLDAASAPALIAREAATPSRASQSLEMPTTPAAHRMWLLVIPALILLGGLATAWPNGTP